MPGAPGPVYSVLSMRRPSLSRPWLVAALAITVLIVVAGFPTLAFAGGDGDFEEYRARGWGWMYLASFGFGFLTSLTPCVYPMIPITLGIFGARGADVSRARRLLLATAYVLGMGVTYSVLGVAAALAGANAGALLANPWFVIPLVILFVAMSASLFGAFDINLPASWQAKLNQVGGKGFGGAFAMGLVGGFIAAPCTGPFLAGLLAFVSQTRDVIGGGSLLFVYALGMGVLFWVLAAAAMSLPKSGRWMDNVKSIGGILLLGGAFYFLLPLIPQIEDEVSPDVAFLLGSLGLVVVGLIAGAVHLSFGGSLADKCRKAVGVMLVVGGLVGAFLWTDATDTHLPWEHDEAAAFAKARAEGKGVMIDFAAIWCKPCKGLEKTFGKKRVYRELVENFVPLKFDVSEDTAEDRARQEMYQAKTLPAVVFLDADRNELARIRTEVSADKILEVVAPAIEKLEQANVRAQNQ